MLVHKGGAECNKGQHKKKKKRDLDRRPVLVDKGGAEGDKGQHNHEHVKEIAFAVCGV